MLSKLRIERLQAGLRLSDLRDLTNISTARLSYYERGVTVPIEERLKIAKALKRPIRELFGG